MKDVCKVCKDTLFFHKGLEGKNSDETKIMFVAHKPDKRVRRLVLPIFDSYEIVLASTKTGKNMGALLDYCGLFWDDLF